MSKPSISQRPKSFFRLPRETIHDAIPVEIEFPLLSLPSIDPRHDITEHQSSLTVTQSLDLTFQSQPEPLKPECEFLRFYIVIDPRCNGEYLKCLDHFQMSCFQAVEPHGEVTRSIEDVVTVWSRPGIGIVFLRLTEYIREFLGDVLEGDAAVVLRRELGPEFLAQLKADWGFVRAEKASWVDAATLGEVVGCDGGWDVKSIGVREDAVLELLGQCLNAGV